MAAQVLGCTERRGMTRLGVCERSVEVIEKPYSKSEHFPYNLISFSLPLAFDLTLKLILLPVGELVAVERT